MKLFARFLVTMFCALAFLMAITMMTACRKEFSAKGPRVDTLRQKCSCRPMPGVDSARPNTLEPGT